MGACCCDQVCRFGRLFCMNVFASLFARFLPHRSFFRDRGGWASSRGASVRSLPVRGREQAGRGFASRKMVRVGDTLYSKSGSGDAY